MHVHTGSEIKDVDVFIKVADIFFDLVPHFQDLQVLDMGGGLIELSIVSGGGIVTNRTLKNAGAKEVYLLALARSRL